MFLQQQQASLCRDWRNNNKRLFSLLFSLSTLLPSAHTASMLPPFLQVDPPPVPPPSDLRLEALYASTSAQKLSNPTGYESNVAWWKTAIEETLRSGWINGQSGDRLVLRADNALGERLAGASGRRPRGLGGVIVSVPAGVVVCSSKIVQDLA